MMPNMWKGSKKDLPKWRKNEMIKLNGLQPVWDKTIIDEERTTADFEIGTPVKKECVFKADLPWELGMAHYANVIEDQGKYKMYYISHMKRDKKKSVITPGETLEFLDLYVCYAESEDGLHITRGGFEFKLDRGTRKGSIGFAVLILAVGGLYLAAQLLKWDVSLWSILWPTTLLVFGLFGSMPWPSFGCLACTGFGAYFLLNNLHILPFDLGWKLALPVAMLLLGVSLLVKAIRRPRSRTVKFSDNGEHITSSCTTDEETFTCDNSFCSKNYHIDLPRLTSGRITVSFGDITVDLSGIEQIAENCSVEVDTSFGESTILVPSKYHVALARNAAFGAISVHGEPAPNPDGTIRINANVSFGEININYI